VTAARSQGGAIQVESWLSDDDERTLANDVKDLHVIEAAYNDSQGVTADDDLFGVSVSRLPQRPRPRTPFSPHPR
jgi:hypothetical protein